ncbi:hypothetical protein [Dokdonella sp.]|uniref:hypothetical protein n=1 Tax=Dokdonella sp. TaxID=2291710 RepID=UPI002F40FB90
MRPNPIRGFEELLIVLTLGALLMVSAADFQLAFLAHVLPGELAIFRRIGHGVVLLRNLISTWPAFVAGLLCGMTLPRRAKRYACLVAAPMAVAPLFSGIVPITVSYAVLTIAFAWAGAITGLRLNPIARIPASAVPDDTSRILLAGRALASSAVAIATLCAAGLLHNVILGRIKEHTISALVFFSAMPAAAALVRRWVRSPFVERNAGHSSRST